jgi:DNA-binding transcriptional ArsR family regulator
MAKRRLDIFEAIAGQARRQILFLLSNKSLNIHSLAQEFHISRPAVSQHVKVLYHVGSISIENIGREHLYMLKQEGFNELHEWLRYYDTLPEK